MKVGPLVGLSNHTFTSLISIVYVEIETFLCLRPSHMGTQLIVDPHEPDSTAFKVPHDDPNSARVMWQSVAGCVESLGHHAS